MTDSNKIVCNLVYKNGRNELIAYGGIEKDNSIEEYIEIPTTDYSLKRSDNPELYDGQTAYREERRATTEKTERESTIESSSSSDNSYNEQATYVEEKGPTDNKDIR